MLTAMAAPRFEAVGNKLTNLAARNPKGGSKGGGGGKFGGGDDDDDDESSVCTPKECASDEKLCGDDCIPSDGVCCGESTLAGYCQADYRCVSTSFSTDSYRCCPEDDFSCDEDAVESTLTEVGRYPGVTCDASRALLNGAWVLGAAGILVALGA